MLNTIDIAFFHPIQHQCFGFVRSLEFDIHGGDFSLKITCMTNTL